MTNNAKLDYIHNYEQQNNYPKNAIADVIIFESGLSTTAQNRHSNATGLIQFMPSTAAGLGTTIPQLLQMNFHEQFLYVDKYFNPYKLRLLSSKDSFDFYCAVLYPKLIGKPDTEIFALSPTKIYSQNAGLDLNKDGITTKGEIRKTFYKSVALSREILNLPASIKTNVIDLTDLAKLGLPIALAIAGVIIWSND